jgi:indolepyruvate ferredoxin oxidoreductase beta subunit
MKDRNTGKEIYGVFMGGVGGLGLLTLGRIIADAALMEGYNVKTSEFHGLAQRYGTLQTQVRFSKGPIHSSTIPTGQADLVIGLEPLEALRGAIYASRQAGTKYLVNTYRMYPIGLSVERKQYPKLEGVLEQIRGFAKEMYHLNASEIVQKETGDIMLTNTYLMGVVVARKLLPLKRASILKSLLNIVPPEFKEQNRKIFAMGERHKF